VVRSGRKRPRHGTGCLALWHPQAIEIFGATNPARLYAKVARISDLSNNLPRKPKQTDLKFFWIPLVSELERGV
jgi:hypothetical protein